MRRGFRARHYIDGLRAVAAAALFAGGLIARDAGAIPPTVDFDIPAGDLADSLDRFSEQSGLQVVYDYSLVRHRVASAVAGIMPPREALDRFLVDSGLAWHFANDDTVVLRPAVAERPRRAPRTRAAKRTDPAVTDITVVADGRSASPSRKSAASFGIDKSLLDTPRSVSLVDVGTIDLLGMSAVEDLVRVVPGVYTTTRWGIQGSVDVRNVPADTYFRGMKRVNLQGHGRSVLAAMETIEVVKGPPSPIFGMGKIGGYTNMTPRSVRAESGGYLTAPQGFVQGILGSYDKAEMSFGIGGPLPLEHEQGGYYVYGLFEDSGTFIDQVPVQQRVVQAAMSLDEVIGEFRIEAGLNLQRSRTAGALIGRFTQDVADTGRYVRGTPLVDLDANGNGRIGYLEMYAGSPVAGQISSTNQALRQVFPWPTAADGTRLPLDGSASVPGIPQSLHDYLVEHPEADPTGLLRAQGPGGPSPISGHVPLGFALDPRTVGFDELDLRRPSAFERELRADFVTGYVDLVNDVDPNLTIKNQLFIDGMDQYKVSEQPFSQLQDVRVIEDKLTIARRHARAPAGVDLASAFSANVRRTTAEGLMALGDYANHRGDAMSESDRGARFATPLLNDVLENDGTPWSSRYATESWDIGVGALVDLTLRERTNVIVGARADYSRATNVDYGGTLNLAAGTSASPAVFRAEDERASGRDGAVSWSVSVSHRINGVRPYVTVAEQSLALDENNNKYSNAVIEAGHIGRARLVEAGVKAELLDDRLYVSAAAYDQTRIGVSLDDPPDVLDAHASSTATRGVEAELRWEASETLLLSFYGLRQHTEFAPNVGANVMVDARALGFRDVLDAQGNVVYPAEAFLYGGRAFVALPPGMDEYANKSGNPETQLGVTADFRLANRLGVTVSGNYFSSVYSGRMRSVELPSASVVNVGVSWRADRWWVKCDVLNALDERWFRARTGDTLGDNLVSAMPGRRMEVTLRTRF